jgi:chromosome segregation ATPase
MSLFSTLPRLLPAFALSLTLGLAQAQTAPAKPAAKPAAAPAKKAAAADEKTLSMGSGGASAPDGAPRRGLLDRDELRTCLKEEGTIRTRLEEAEKQRKALNEEKGPIEADRNALKDERAALEGRQKLANEALQVKFKAYSDRVESWNKRVADFNEAKKTGAAADRESKALNDERVAMEKDRPALDAEKNAIVARVTDDVNVYNERAKKVDARSADWNRRNNEANDNNQALEGERKTWVATCANRRYREEDELAIKQGK